MMKAGAFLEALDNERIVAAIKAAEARSRGEIRVHVAEGEVDDARTAAQADFSRLGMTKTAERNGVLILLAPESRSCAVVGDEGIDRRCPEGFWARVAETLREGLHRERFTDGIVAAVALVGEELERHFPRRPGEIDRNELPDTIGRG
jgi:uncharacterized membrane protein